MNMAKTIILQSILIAYVALTSLVSISTCDPLTEPSITSGFTADLIHRDSLQSPSYDPTSSPYKRLVNSLRRSFNRARRFNVDSSSKSQQPEADIINASGEYLIKYSVGSPPVSSLGVADTGSDLIWTQCQPCLRCFNQTVPIFNPKSSSTYRRIPCDSANCKSLNETLCSTRRKNCLYNETYGDGSFSQGELSMDTFTLGSTSGKSISVPNITFGCGFRNGIVFEGGESGVVGLGGGKASLVRQLGPLAQGKFSYCLVTLSGNSNSSKLSFGANAVVSGRGVVSTPLVSKNGDTFYYLTLEGISVGNQRLELYNNASADAGKFPEGNMIIDSGTTLMMLPTDLYVKLETAMENTIKLKRVKDPQGVLNLCYSTRKDIEIPEVIVHFKGADVKLKIDNVFVRTSDIVVCMAATPTDEVAVYGNVAQMDFLVGYDLQNRTVSFKAANCGKE